MAVTRGWGGGERDFINIRSPRATNDSSVCAWVCVPVGRVLSLLHCICVLLFWPMLLVPFLVMVLQSIWGRGCGRAGTHAGTHTDCYKAPWATPHAPWERVSGMPYFRVHILCLTILSAVFVRAHQRATLECFRPLCQCDEIVSCLPLVDGDLITAGFITLCNSCVCVCVWTSNKPVSNIPVLILSNPNSETVWCHFKLPDWKHYWQTSTTVFYLTRLRTCAYTFIDTLWC